MLLKATRTWTRECQILHASAAMRSSRVQGVIYLEACMMWTCESQGGTGQVEARLGDAWRLHARYDMLDVMGFMQVLARG